MMMMVEGRKEGRNGEGLRWREGRQKEGRQTDRHTRNSLRQIRDNCESKTPHGIKERGGNGGRKLHLLCGAKFGYVRGNIFLDLKNLHL